MNHPPIPVGDDTADAVEERNDLTPYRVSNPSQALWDWLVVERRKNVHKVGYEWGMIAMGCELLSIVRIVESVPASALISATHEDVSRVCEDLLNRLGIRETVESTYDKLIEREAQVRRKYVSDVVGRDVDGAAERDPPR